MDIYWIPGATDLHFRVHRWRDGALEETVAASSSIDAARAAFDALCREYPDKRFTLQHRGRVIADSERN